MRRITVSLLVAALLSAGGVIVATPAGACSCVVTTTQDHFERADAVFTARLVSRTEPTGQIISSTDPALHVFAVDTVFKGTVREEQDVLSPMSGASCGLELFGDGPVVVFAVRSADGSEDRYTAGLCDGTAPATADLEAELRALAGPQPSGATPAPPADGGAASPAGGGTTQLSGSAPTTPGGLATLVLAAVATLVLVSRLVMRRRMSSGADDGGTTVP